MESLSGSFWNMYRVPQEPNLEEWTCRAESTDLLHEPVGCYSKADLYYPSLLAEVIFLFLLIGRFV